jgi:hypothetical protein
MHSYELVEALADVPGNRVEVARGALTVHIPAIGDSVRLAPEDVLDAESVFVPTGAPAVQLDVRRGHEVLPLIVTVDDVVFTPAYADDMIEPGAELRVPAMPSLIAYSEMHRDVRALGRTIDDPGAALDPEILAATLLAHRCFLAGAVRVGLWPVRVAAWWEYTSARVGDGVVLARFRADPVWDDLMADVTEARRHTAAQPTGTAAQPTGTAAE